MSYLTQVIEARHISGFIVSARFDDGTEKRIDVLNVQGAGVRTSQGSEAF